MKVRPESDVGRQQAIVTVYHLGSDLFVPCKRVCRRNTYREVFFYVFFAYYPVFVHRVGEYGNVTAAVEEIFLYLRKILVQFGGNGLVGSGIRLHSGAGAQDSITIV